MNLPSVLLKGDIAKSVAISTFTKLGFRIGMLLTESAPYDLLVDTGEGVKRVSVKYLGSKNDSLDLRNIHTNSKGYVVRKTVLNEYDWLYIYCSDRREYLYKDCLVGRSSIVPKKEFLLEGLS